MSDTKQRIAEYKQLLPGLKERIVAVALLLVISLTMVTTTTFAWVVLSRNPEVSGMATTLAANGNLEIALATGTGYSPPKESGIGDSFVAGGQTIGKANLTWGNLINLGDASYGLDYLTLRPARLNENGDLRQNPLYTAVYTADGRFKSTNDQFAYTQWDSAKTAFTISNGYGVRAISSTRFTVDNEESALKYLEFIKKQNEAKSAIVSVGDAYEAVANPNTSDPDYATKMAQMESLAYLMGVHMSAILNTEDKYTKAKVDSKHVQNMIELCNEFLEVYELEAEAMASILNLQLFLDGKEEKYSQDMLLNEDLSSDTFIQDVFSFPDDARNNSYILFKQDYTLIKNNLAQLDLISKKGGDCYQWTADVSAYNEEGLTKNLKDIVNALVNVNTCLIRVRNGSDNFITIQALLDSFKDAGLGDLLSLNSKYNNKSCDTVITNGVFYNLADRIGRNLEEVGASSNSNKGLKATASVYSSSFNYEASAIIYAIISTNAEGSVLSDIMKSIEYDDSNVNKIETAEDTYGMAIDFWVRTNAAASYLVLEGNVLTKTETVPETTTDMDGNEVELYSLTRTVKGENGEDLVDTHRLYKKGDTWYTDIVHEEFELNAGETPTKIMVEVETVIGYEGDNRVWDEYDPNDSNIGLNVNKTTQGSGSCYVFYFETPEERDRSLTLLKALTVVFMDTQTGDVLATAHMDTKRYYEESGKVTVPLTLDADSKVAGFDDDENPIYGITLLEQNVPLMITTLVYLDGSLVTNSDVLSDNNIQGKLNIQFGSSEDLHPVNDEELKNEEIDISAEITGATNVVFDANNHPSSSVKVTVEALGKESYEAKTVTAYFIRMLNQTQGIREKQPITFTKVLGESGEEYWTADYTFTAPGRYVIRSILVNGVEYDVDSPFPEVVVSGFEVGTIQYDLKPSVLTGASSYSGFVSFKFATDDPAKMPKTVLGRFVSADGLSTATVDFVYDPTESSWTGQATFRKSGEYAFEYLVLDNEYYYIAEEDQFNINVSLGVKVKVYTSSPTEFKYLPSEMKDNQKNLSMTVSIFNDADEEIEGISGVELFYRQVGSDKGMYTDLKWNGSMYSGILQPLNAGRFVFGYVSIGENIIKQADTSPEFVLISPNPPEFISAVAPGDDGYVYAPKNDAKFEVIMAYAGGTTITATIRNTKTNATHTVTAEEGAEATDHPKYDEYPSGTLNRYYFTINNGATQDGEWELVSITSINGYAADGTQYTEENPWVHKLTESVSVKVVSTLTITFNNANTTLSGHGFMEAYSVSAGTLTVTIQDFDQKPIQGIKNVSMEFTYVNGTSSKYGGYSGVESGFAGTKVTVPFSTTPGSTTYTQSENVSFLYAGAYGTKLSITFDDDTVTPYEEYDGNEGSTVPLTGMPKFTVSTVTPTVKISARTSYGSSSHTDTSATVYFNESKNSTCGITTTNYSQPSVTITLSGYGKASGASLAFAASNNGTVHLYTSNGGTSAVSTYTWTGNGECLRWVGYYQYVSGGSDRKTAAGTLTATTLVLTYNGDSYTVDIPDITISNPS